MCFRYLFKNCRYVVCIDDNIEIKPNGHFEENYWPSSKMYQDLIDNVKPEFKIILDKDEDNLTDDDKEQLELFQELYIEKFIKDSLEKYTKDNIISKSVITAEIYSWIDSIF